MAHGTSMGFDRFVLVLTGAPALDSGGRVLRGCVALWHESVSVQGPNHRGAAAGQIVHKFGSVRRIEKHLGSAHNEARLETLMETGRLRNSAEQGQGPWT